MKVIETNMNGHRKRNSKTSLMFTLSIAFLIFSASSFELILDLIEKTYLQLIGADLGVVTWRGYLTEIPIANFLDTQIENGLVVDYCFVSKEMNKLLRTGRSASDPWWKSHEYNVYVGDASQYNYVESHVIGVPENYLKVTDITYYYPDVLQDNVKVNTTENGYLDAVEMLYSDESLTEYIGWPSDNTDYYNVCLGEYNYKLRFTETIKVLLSSAMKFAISATPGDIIKIRDYSTNTDWTYRAQVRGLIQKMPGILFSSYK